MLLPPSPSAGLLLVFDLLAQMLLLLAELPLLLVR